MSKESKFALFLIAGLCSLGIWSYRRGSLPVEAISQLDEEEQPVQQRRQPSAHTPPTLRRNSGTANTSSRAPRTVRITRNQGQRSAEEKSSQAEAGTDRNTRSLTGDRDFGRSRTTSDSPVIRRPSLAKAKPAEPNDRPADASGDPFFHDNPPDADDLVDVVPPVNVVDAGRDAIRATGDTAHQAAHDLAERFDREIHSAQADKGESTNETIENEEDPLPLRERVAAQPPGEGATGARTDTNEDGDTKTLAAHGIVDALAGREPTAVHPEDDAMTTDRHLNEIADSQRTKTSPPDVAEASPPDHRDQLHSALTVAPAEGQPTAADPPAETEHAATSTHQPKEDGHAAHWPADKDSDPSPGSDPHRATIHARSRPAPPPLRPPASAKPRNSTPPPTGHEFVVHAHDDFWKISQRLFGTGGYAQAIERHNSSRLASDGVLQAGDVLLVPSAAELRRLYPELCPQLGGVAAGEDDSDDAGGRPRARVIRRTHVVEEGDTLFDIARLELGRADRWVEIYQRNQAAIGENIDYLPPGLELTLPNELVSDGNPPSRSVFRRR